jgi:hypothetical protein
MRRLLSSSSLLVSIAAAFLIGGCATKDDVGIVQSTANQAVTTANQAVTTANQALTTSQTATNTAQAALHRAGDHDLARYDQPRVSRTCVRWSSSTGRCVQTANVPVRATADWFASCSRRYRSFNPASGTYLGYDGLRHYCVL